MNLTVFEYITKITGEIVNELWFELTCRSFNLIFTLFWLYRYVHTYDENLADAVKLLGQETSDMSGNLSGKVSGDKKRKPANP